MITTFPKHKGFWSITAGNVGSWLVMGVGFVAWGQRLSDKVDTIGARVTVHERDLDTLTRQGLKTTIEQHEKRLVDLEKAISGLSEMSTDIKWIKRRLNEKEE